MKNVMIAAVFAALVSAPAVAVPKAQFDRDTALRECSTAAGKYGDRDSNMPILQFRACMTQHGQPE